ncbi:MAG TPA: mechanosensitive ion channel family protein [Longimicrobiales bacterium]
MTFLEWTIYGNTLRAWITALLAAGAIFAILEIVKGMLLRRHAPRAESVARVEEAGAEGGVLRAALTRTHVAWLALVSAYLGSRFLFFPADVEARLRAGAVIVFCIQGAVWAVAALEFLLRRGMWRRHRADAATATAFRVLGVVGRAGVWMAFALLALANVGVEVTPLLTGLGVGGIAVALAVQNILGDILAALSIALDRPFTIGDAIAVGDLTGTVEHVGLKTTRLRGEAGEQIILANADLLRSRIRNYGRVRERQVALTVSVSSAAPPEKLARVPALIREIVEAQDATRFARAHLHRLDGASLEFKAVYHVLDPGDLAALDVQQAVHLELLRRFEEEGLEIAGAAHAFGAGAGVPAGGVG